MAKVELDDDWVAAKGEVGSMLGRHEAAIFGNGQPGLSDVVKDFVSRQEERDTIVEAAQTKRHQENSDKIDRQNRILTLIGVLISVIMLYFAYKEFQGHGHAQLFSDSGTVQAAQISTSGKSY